MEQLKPGKYSVILRDQMNPEKTTQLIVEVTGYGIGVSLQDNEVEVAAVMAEVFEDKFRAVYWTADVDYFEKDPEIAVLADVKGGWNGT